MNEKNENEIEYKNITCTNNTRKIDDLLKQYSKDRLTIFNLLKSNPNELSTLLWNRKNGLLNIDETCQCKMGMYDGEYILKSTYNCVQCKQVGRILDLLPENMNKPFRIETGKRKNDALIITTNPNVVLFTEFKNSHRLSSEHTLKYYNKLSVCDSSLDLNQKYLLSDEFTNNFLISLLLEQLLKNQTVIIQSIYVCGRDGYTLSDKYQFFYRS